MPTPQRLPGGAPLHIQIKVFGDVQLERKLMTVGGRGRHMLPVFDELGHKLSGIQREQFATSGARGGRRWQPLAASTIARKGHDEILVDSGALRDSFMYGDENHIFLATDDFLHWGSDVEYGAFHQPDPQDRRVFQLTEVDRVEIIKDIQHWIRYGSVRF
jgi:phage gpG-like protein